MSPVQQTAVSAPPIPPPPTPEPPPTSAIQTVPSNPLEVAALRGQREELSNQLNSAIGRRNRVVDQLETATAAERPGLEARLKLLDDRILAIEGEIARTGALIAQAPGQWLSSTSADAPIAGFSRNLEITPIAIIFTLFVMAPMAFAVARNVWKRGTRLSAPPPPLDKEAVERLRRLEDGVDAIALEVERISEGQRFVTKLMAEREKQRVSSGE